MNRPFSLRWYALVSSTSLAPLRGLGIVSRRIVRWRRLVYERRLLASLDDRMLRDIGVTRSDAQAESRKPFWREH